MREDSGLIALQELRRLEANRRLEIERQLKSETSADAPKAPLNPALLEKDLARSTALGLRASLDHAIVVWQERLDKLHRFVTIRQTIEKTFIVSLVLLASIASSAQLLQGAYDFLFKVMVALSTMLSVLSAVMFVIDPYRQTKFYAARVRKAISIYQSYRQVLVSVDISSANVDQILSLAQVAREILEPHRVRW